MIDLITSMKKAAEPPRSRYKLSKPITLTATKKEGNCKKATLGVKIHDSES